MKPRAKFSLGEGQLLLTILAGSLIAVLGLFLLTRSGATPRAASVNERPRIQWLPSPDSVTDPELRQRNAVADLQDPSLMSLPNKHGFSRPMLTRETKSSRRSSDWNSEPAFLNTTPSGEFPSLLSRAPLIEAVQAGVEKMTPEPEVDSEEPEPTRILDRSTFRLQGALEGRLVTHSPTLPTFSSDNLLRPTQLRVGVGPDGTVRFASVERSSGDEMVDARAVELARQIRFEPTSDAASQSLTWGVVRFLWAIEPAASMTNTSNGASEIHN